MHFPFPCRWTTLYGVERKGRPISESGDGLQAVTPRTTMSASRSVLTYASPSPLPSWMLLRALNYMYGMDGFQDWFSILNCFLVWMFANINFCPCGFTPRGDNEKSRPATNLMSNDRLLSGYLTTMTTLHLDAQFSHEVKRNFMRIATSEVI